MQRKASNLHFVFADVFGKNAMIAAYSMYVIGLVVAVFVAFILHIADKKEANGMLIIELPEYKAPSARTIWIYVWEKVKDYLTKVGTVIFLASIAMWLLLNFGIHGYTNEMSESFGAAIGHFIVPVLKPIGLGYWQIPLYFDCRNIGKGSCCIKLCCFVWNSKCKFGSRYGSAASGTWCSRIWYGKCLLSYDFLPAVHPLFCYAGNDS